MECESIDDTYRARLALAKRWLSGAFLVDRDLVIRWVSDSMVHLLGYTARDAVGRPGFDFLHPDDIAACGAIMEFEATIDPSFRRLVRRRNVRYIRVLESSGVYRSMEVAMTNFYDDPEIGMLLLELSAPTQFATLDRVVQLIQTGGDLNETLALVLEQFTSADPQQAAAAVFDEHGEPLAASPNAPRPFGATAPDAFLSTWDLPLHHEAWTAPLGSLRTWSHSQVPHPFDVEESERTAHHAALAISHHRVTSELRRGALCDALTGAANRRALIDAMRDGHEGGHEALVAYLDLNGFKAVNDRYGHDAGDHVLATIAQRLRDSFRSMDVVARIGGDEFVVFVPAPGPGPDIVRKRLERVISAPIDWDGESLSVSCRIGFASGSTAPEDLLRSADQALISQRRAG